MSEIHLWGGPIVRGYITPASLAKKEALYDLISMC